MDNALKTKENSVTLAAHRALLQRILCSPSFHKSARSKQLLEYLGDQYFRGESDAVHEIRIGTELFGRGEQFDPSEDSIVRASMRQLRARLTDYYEREGAEEEWELQIPKGSYRTAFLLRKRDKAEEESVALMDAVLQPVTTAATPRLGKGGLWWITMLRPNRSVGLAILLVLAFTAGMLFRGDGSGQNVLGLVTARAAQESIFEQFLLSTEGDIAFVPSDSVINLIRTYSGKPITLEEYRTRDLFSPMHPLSQRDPDMWRMIISRELLNIGDASVVLRAAKDYPQHSERFHFRQSRDLHARDLKRGHYVFLGATNANPWVGVFDNYLSFPHQADVGGEGPRWKNAHPKADESAWYPEKGSKDASRSYAKISVVPNLSRSGKVMLVAGLSMFDTEAAGEFVMASKSASILAEALGVASLARAPYFEAIVRTEEAGKLWKVTEVVAHRVLNAETVYAAGSITARR